MGRLDRRHGPAPARVPAATGRGVTGRTCRPDPLAHRAPSRRAGGGDLAAQAEAAWADLAAGTDLHLRECLLLRAEALREELAGPAPSPVERLLVGRVVACWTQMAYFDAIEAQSLGTEEKPRLAAFRAKRQEQAHRMYLTSLAALTTLRKLRPPCPMKVLPSSKVDTPTNPERNGHRNGHAGELPPGVHNRIGIYFDEPVLDTKNGHRKPDVAGVGVDD